MKKKIFICCSVAILVVAAILCTIFLLKTKNLEATENRIDFIGTWRVFKEGEVGQVAEYYVIDEENVRDYYADSDSPRVSSKYTYEGDILTLNDLNISLKITIKSNNILQLFNQSGTYHMAKVKDKEYNEPSIYSVADFNGTYDVNLHADAKASDEYMIFENDSFSFYRNGELFLSSSFNVKDNILSISKLNFYICDNTGDKIVLSEITSDLKYYIWELVRR